MMSLLTLLLLPYLVSDDGQPKTPYDCPAVDMKTYVTSVRQSIMENWNPQRGEEAIHCTVVLTQSFRGEVLNVEFEECGHAGSVRITIEDAIYLSSPLPLPDKTHCFERTLKVNLIRPQ